MANIEITKMSSKGQLVIPLEMRKNIKKGEKLIIIQNKDQLIIKKAKDFDKNLEGDLEFARRTEEAYREIGKGNFVKMSKEDFLKKLDQWTNNDHS